MSNWKGSTPYFDDGFNRKPFATQYKNAPDTMKYAVSRKHWLPFDEWVKYQELNRRTKMEHEHPAKPDGYPCGNPAKCPVCGEYHLWHVQQKSNKEVRMNDSLEGTTMTSEDVEGRALYEITTAYGEDRNDVKVITEYVVAESSSRAQLQKKPIPAGWDMDYVTVIVKCLGTVRVKAKPREILATK